MKQTAITRRLRKPAGLPKGRPGRIGGLALILALAAAVLAACGGSSSGGGGSSSGLTQINLGVVSGNSQENAYVAQAKGFFKKHGLNARFTVLTGGGAEAVSALQGGSLTMAEGNIVSVLQGAQHGIQTPCFAGGVAFNSKGYAYAIVGRHGVTSPSQLAGKGIAVISDHSANTLLVDAYLAAHGIDYKSVKYTIVAPPNMSAALTSGSAQAAAAPDPFSTQIIHQGGTLLSRNPDAYIPGHPQFACWQASRGWITSHKNVASRFIAAMNEADSYMAAHPKAANTAAAPLMKVSASSLNALVPWKFTMDISRDDITSWLTAAQRFGILHGSIKMADVLVPVQ